MNGAPYQIAFAVHVVPIDGGLRGSAGWGAVVRRGDGAAEFRGHACFVSEAQLADHGRRVVVATLPSQSTHFFIVEKTAMHEAARADMERARVLARSAATVVGHLMAVVPQRA